MTAPRDESGPRRLNRGPREESGPRGTNQGPAGRIRALWDESGPSGMVPSASSVAKAHAINIFHGRLQVLFWRLHAFLAEARSNTEWEASNADGAPRVAGVDPPTSEGIK